MSATGIMRLSTVDPATASDWAEGWLAVDDQSVATVLLELARYCVAPLRFDDASLSAVHVSGSFPLDNSDSALDVLATAANLHVIRSADGSADISRK